MSVTGVSDGTVASMRRVKKALMDKKPNADLSEYTWIEAFNMSKGKEREDIDWDVQSEKEAQEIAIILGKHLPPKIRSSPETFDRAIEIFDTRLPEYLQKYWGKYDDNPEEEVVE